MSIFYSHWVFGAYRVKMDHLKCCCSAWGVLGILLVELGYLLVQFVIHLEDYDFLLTASTEAKHARTHGCTSDMNDGLAATVHTLEDATHISCKVHSPRAQRKPKTIHTGAKIRNGFATLDIHAAVQSCIPPSHPERKTIAR